MTCSALQNKTRQSTQQLFLAGCSSAIHDYNRHRYAPSASCCQLQLAGMNSRYEIKPVAAVAGSVGHAACAVQPKFVQLTCCTRSIESKEDWDVSPVTD